MSFFGFGDVEILVIGALVVLFFGKEKVKEWYKELLTAKKSWETTKAEAEMEATKIKAGAKG